MTTLITHHVDKNADAKASETLASKYMYSHKSCTAHDKIATAWCSDTPNETLTAIKNGKRITTSVCADNPVADHYRLGGSMGVTGTPAIILMDGTLIPGYKPAAELAEFLGVSSTN